MILHEIHTSYLDVRMMSALILQINKEAKATCQLEEVGLSIDK
jgi:hypothetical protein